MMTDQEHLAAPQTIQKQSGSRYGSRRLHAALDAAGYALGRDHVRRLMRLGHLQSPRPLRQRRSRNQARPVREQVVPNLLERQFTVTAPDRWWVGDITTLVTAEGDLHLAGVLDLGTREVVGWSTAATMIDDNGIGYDGL